MNQPPDQEIEHCQNLRSAPSVLLLHCSFPGLQAGRVIPYTECTHFPSACDYFFLSCELLFYLHPRLTCISLLVLPTLQVLRLLFFHILPSRNPPPSVLHPYKLGSQEIDHIPQVGFPSHDAGRDGWRTNLEE